MIKLLSLLLPFVLVHAEQSNFLFPDQKNDFLHRLTQSLKHAQNRIVIISPSFEQPLIQKSLLAQTKKGNHIDLIVQRTDGSVLSLIQYANIELSHFSVRTLEGSIIMVDRNFACTLTAPIDEAHISHTTSFAHCTDEPDEITEILNNISPLMRRSKPYLK